MDDIIEEVGDPSSLLISGAPVSGLEIKYYIIISVKDKGEGKT
jgi:hypothetical protein